MKPSWLKLLVGVVLVVVMCSVAIGLASPDGSVDDVATPVNQGPRPSTEPAGAPAPTDETAPGPTEAPAETAESSSPDLAPSTVSGAWPGRPRGTTAAKGDVDWCGAVSTTGADEAVRIFGRESVDAAACAAVSFVFDHRYSRLSLPRKTYEESDFDEVLAVLDDSTAASVYRPRISSFVARPGGDRSGEQLGLVLFTGSETPKGSVHASAGRGHVFYGKAFSGRGYRDRAVWINPQWSTVSIRVDRSTAQPRIEARLTASAALPVYDTIGRRDAMITLPTRATFVLKDTGAQDWRINGWTISRDDASYTALDVR